jgi:hypothetical protein
MWLLRLICLSYVVQYFKPHPLTKPTRRTMSAVTGDDADDEDGWHRRLTVAEKVSLGLWVRACCMRGQEQFLHDGDSQEDRIRAHRYKRRRTVASYPSRRVSRALACADTQYDDVGTTTMTTMMNSCPEEDQRVSPYEMEARGLHVLMSLRYVGHPVAMHLLYKTSRRCLEIVNDL